MLEAKVTLTPIQHKKFNTFLQDLTSANSFDL